jgi:hypothetical protein
MLNRRKIDKYYYDRVVQLINVGVTRTSKTIEITRGRMTSLQVDLELE